MKTRIKILGLLIAMLFTVLPTLAYDFEADGIYYNLLSASARTCEITYGDVKYSGDFVVPSSVLYKNKELRVERIGDKAFSGCNKLTSISIAESNTVIGNEAFKDCTSLKYVTLPNSIVSLGQCAFEGCNSLNSVSISSSISKIDFKTFSGCSSLSYINIPENVTEIGKRAFEYCENLIDITLPQSLNIIGVEAFLSCKKLININLPEAIKYIEARAFGNCLNLQNITLPATITQIHNYTFSCCRSISEIIIPENVTEIGDYAFEDCDGLTTITIPKNVTTLRQSIFQSCDNLTSVVFESSSEKLYIREWYTYPGYEVFYECPNIISLTLGRNIYNYAEEEDKIGNGIPALGLNNISKLTLLPNINFELLECSPYQQTIEEIIYSSGFNGSSLNNGRGLHLEKFVNLKSITIESDTPPERSPYVTNEQRINLIIFVPKGSISNYQNANGWKDFWDIREIEISDVKDVHIGKGLDEIGRFDIHGNRANKSTKGTVIICYSDGSTKKIIQK